MRPTLITVHPNRLHPNPWNTNIVSPENEEKLRNSLTELGQFKPIVVREISSPEGEEREFQILGGEHRWRELLDSGATEVDVYNLGVIDDDKAKRISIADNARYGADDALELARLLESLGDPEGLQKILPFSETDMNAFASTADIAIDELDVPDELPAEAEKPTKAPKTHTMMRFKVPLKDAEAITDLITKIQGKHGYSGSDELTNAGDALVHLLLGVGD